MYYPAGKYSLECGCGYCCSGEGLRQQSQNPLLGTRAHCSRPWPLFRASWRRSHHEDIWRPVGLRSHFPPYAADRSASLAREGSALRGKLTCTPNS
jgi:hypothetical protein